MEQTQGSSSSNSFVFAYGPYLHPVVLPTLLGKGCKPISTSPARTCSCYLSFDIPGLPWINPSFCNALIEGVNDGGWKDGLDEKEVLRVGQGWKDDARYRKWVWERCSPGAEYYGDLPPRLEGMLFEISPSRFAELFGATISSSSISTSEFELHQIKVTRMSYADLTPVSSEIVHAFIPIIRNGSGRSVAKLQPTRNYLRMVLFPSFLAPLSRPFMAHMMLIRPYVPKRNLLTRIINLALVPGFLLTLVGLRTYGQGWKDGVERVFGKWEGRLKSLFGSGWRNDPGVKDVTR